MKMFDIPASILAILTGVVFLSFRSRLRIATLGQVSKGEITELEARKRSRIFTQVGYTSLAVGVGLAVSHYLTN
jgi:hypothetical protein